ncbi:Traf and Tnf receptor associated protein, isoform CRA_a [Mus musculus]|nr:Traf and Tnf receptor associated protein, isoform CRA_a [Mus musculus]
MASGSSSDAAEPAGPAGRAASAPEAAQAEEDRVKRRRLQCLGFALVGGCDPTMVPSVLRENDWQTQKALSAYFELPENDQGWPRQPPTSFKSEAYLPFASIASDSSTPYPNFLFEPYMSRLTWNSFVVKACLPLAQYWD